jgi:hypothetical protein
MNTWLVSVYNYIMFVNWSGLVLFRQDAAAKFTGQKLPTRIISVKLIICHAQSSNLSL